MRRDPLPRETVRDLLGITRTLFATIRATRPEEKRTLETLRRIGVLFREALEMSAKFEPGTLGHSAAWSRAQQALDKLSEEVSVGTTLLPLVENASARVRGVKVPARSNRRDRH